MWPWIVYNKSRETENYRLFLKSGVDFQIALKQNCTTRNCVKQELPVLGGVCSPNLIRV
jgi:hypothetical protein